MSKNRVIGTAFRCRSTTKYAPAEHAGCDVAVIFGSPVIAARRRESGATIESG